MAVREYSMIGASGTIEADGKSVNSITANIAALVAEMVGAPLSSISLGAPGKHTMRVEAKAKPKPGEPKYKAVAL